MSKINRRSLFLGAASLPAIALPSVAADLGGSSELIGPRNSLCPWYWDEFYNIFKGVTDDTFAFGPYGREFFMAINKEMMVRYPKWFEVKYMMTGPTSLFAAKNGERVCAQAKTAYLKTTKEMYSPDFSVCLREEIQDSRACGSLIGKNLKTLVEDATDELNTIWSHALENGFRPMPYLPLIPLDTTPNQKYDDDRQAKESLRFPPNVAAFKSRYALVDMRWDGNDYKSTYRNGYSL